MSNTTDNASGKAGKVLDSSPDRWDRLDRRISFTLICVPLLLTGILLLQLALQRKPLLAAPSVSGAWFFELVQASEHEMAWGDSLREQESANSMYGISFGPYDGFPVYQQLFAKGMASQAAAQPQRAGNPEIQQALILINTIGLQAGQHDNDYPMGNPSERATPALDYLQEQQARGGLDRINSICLAQALYNSVNDQIFSPMFPGQDPVYVGSSSNTSINSIWLAEDQREATETALADSNASPSANAFPYYIEALRLIYAEEFETAAEMLQAAASRDMQDTNLAILAALDIPEPAGLDPLTRTLLWQYGRDNWLLLDFMDASKFDDASAYWSARADTAQLQELHAALLRLEPLLGRKKWLECEKALFQGLPGSALQDPANQAWLDADNSVSTIETALDKAQPIFTWELASLLDDGLLQLSDCFCGNRINHNNASYTFASYLNNPSPSLNLHNRLSADTRGRIRAMEQLDWRNLVLPAPIVQPARTDGGETSESAADGDEELSESAADGDTAIDDTYYTPWQPGQDQGKIH